MNNNIGGIDKFGRFRLRYGSNNPIPGPPGPGFLLADGGTAYNLEQRRLMNVGDPKNLNDAINLQYVQNNCLTFSNTARYVSCHSKRLVSLNDPIDLQDGATKNFVIKKIEELDRLVHQSDFLAWKQILLLTWLLKDRLKTDLTKGREYLETVNKLSENIKDPKTKLQSFVRDFFNHLGDDDIIPNLKFDRSDAGSITSSPVGTPSQAIPDLQRKNDLITSFQEMKHNTNAGRGN